MPKLKIQIKHYLTGSVLFEYESENNTIAKTVEEAARQGADLRYANLSSADLSYANLSSADLSYANLRSANLSSANLRYANLISADLISADLSSANLSSADLSYTNLSYADLSYANLRSANLSSANLRYANLSYADLSSANLRYANLSYAKNSDLAVTMTRILPEGSIIGWKRCRNNSIVKLRIPEEAKRSHAFGRKCRAEYAEVLEIWSKTGKPRKTTTSSYDDTFKYRIGETVRPVQGYDEDWTNECSSGIHFFITRLEAESY